MNLWITGQTCLTCLWSEWTLRRSELQGVVCVEDRCLTGILTDVGLGYRKSTCLCPETYTSERWGTGLGGTLEDGVTGPDHSLFGQTWTD